MGPKSAINAINRHGMLLVYPIHNASEPKSLWSVAYPRTKMKWEWDDSASDKVAELWHLRSELSTSEKVIYTKWFKGRATFFSIPVFRALLALLMRRPNFHALSRTARQVMEALEENSPQSTKALKRATGLVGRDLEADYQRALKELWSRLLIVAYGEVEEGAFPSLAVGATRLLFEEIYREAEAMSADEAKAALRDFWAENREAGKFWDRTQRALLS